MDSKIYYPRSLNVLVIVGEDYVRVNIRIRNILQIIVTIAGTSSIVEQMGGLLFECSVSKLSTFYSISWGISTLGNISGN